MLIKIWDAATSNIFKTVAVLATMGGVSAALVEGYTVYNNAKEIPALVSTVEKEIKKLREEANKERRRVNIAFNVLRCELDHDTLYDDIEESNGGDKWFFTVEDLNSKTYNMMYNASYNNNESQYWYLDLNNKFHWISKNKQN